MVCTPLDAVVTPNMPYGIVLRANLRVLALFNCFSQALKGLKAVDTYLSNHGKMLQRLGPDHSLESIKSLVNKPRSLGPWVQTWATEHTKGQPCNLWSYSDWTTLMLDE